MSRLRASTHSLSEQNGDSLYFALFSVGYITSLLFSRKLHENGHIYRYRKRNIPIFYPSTFLIARSSLDNRGEEVTPPRSVLPF